MYCIWPILLQSGFLPTAVYWNGRRETEFPLWIFVLLYVGGVYQTWNVCYMVVASDLFFAIAIVIFAYRFSSISAIIRLLNYDGVRDRAKDQEIIKECYMMHLDLMG